MAPFKKCRYKRKIKQKYSEEGDALCSDSPVEKLCNNFADGGNAPCNWDNCATRKCINPLGDIKIEAESHNSHLY